MRQPSSRQVEQDCQACGDRYLLLRSRGECLHGRARGGGREPGKDRGVEISECPREGMEAEQSMVARLGVLVDVGVRGKVGHAEPASLSGNRRQTTPLGCAPLAGRFMAESMDPSTVLSRDQFSKGGDPLTPRALSAPFLSGAILTRSHRLFTLR